MWALRKGTLKVLLQVLLVAVSPMRTRLPRLDNFMTMAELTASQRELGWNVRILVKSGVESCFAGFYQQHDLVTVADVWRELELCFVLDQ